MSDLALDQLACVAWDFDGVLNIAGDGWLGLAAEELGVRPAALQQALFAGDTRDLLVGRQDVLDRLEDWGRETGFDGAPEDILEIWYDNGVAPDEDVLRLIEQIDRTGVQQVLVANTDARRARYLESDTTLTHGFDGFFASGFLGDAMPEAAFFEHIEGEMALDGAQFLIISGNGRVLKGARKRSWQIFEYQPGSVRELVTDLMPLLLAAGDPEA